ncbi:NlpC/P60 family protein [Sphingomonas sp. PL-96]|uniref:NlpC/P60 family protein n=1 Tax=Sphingomonas sp. PL-96 TaxID=2887201 RepID=UPI001E62945B|nr:NlpC/P60 family protein [Sphingomonas sp. PL-96]MCC2975976.1 NlpC/P60 family protein [Sphingomonas sp. PL-96]
MRVDAARRDLADVRLADRVFAPHYALAVPRTAGRAVPLLARGNAPETVQSEVLAGEPFDALEFSGDHIWGLSPVDGSVGFVEAAAFTAVYAPTHIVAVRNASIRALPSSDSKVLGTLAMGSRVAATGAGESAFEVDGGYVDADALLPLDALALDIATVAERLIGAPARAGGRSGAGVDAAGLVFLCLQLAGVEAPRFLDLQGAMLGMALIPEAPFVRGQVLFFEDHSAVVVDAENAIHVSPDGVARAPIAALVAAHGTIVRRRQP